MHSAAGNRIREMADELATAVGADLVSLVLYGSGTGADYVEGLSDINVLVVVCGNPVDVLSRLRTHWRAWRKRGLAVPLVVERQFLRRAADVFPMEIVDIQHCHEVLRGEEVLKDLVIDRDRLRQQLEFELRSKWLKLASLYVESQNLGRAALEVLLEAAKSFCVLLRHLLRLTGTTPAGTYRELAEQAERGFALSLPTTKALLEMRQQMRQQRLRWRTDCDRLLRDLLAEMGQVVDVADRLVFSGECLR